MYAYRDRARPEFYIRTERRRRARLVQGVRGGLPHPCEKMGEADIGPSPVDRRKTGSKHHLICDGRSTPLKVITTAANVNDVTQPLALVDGIPRWPDVPADHAAAPIPCLGTRATTPTPTARNCVSAGSCR
ncbi:hypothetical protein CW362_19780 [Streptomyces populi]|uniref:Transposase IS4-like domain-containing protein n=1 Tax=Streptomyces populi TaxID=2058924 RepID=A0A2I0SN24_9ACTN|nr:hypothetical protein CW362_19780 [Streptomyces populi]